VVGRERPSVSGEIGRPGISEIRGWAATGGEVDEKKKMEEKTRLEREHIYRKRKWVMSRNSKG